MQARVNFYNVVPGLGKAMNGLEDYLAECGLEPSLKELVRMRASQINGCAYCIDAHSLEARALGESEQRLYALSAWHETPFFSERERAALLWTEKLTLISVDHVPDEVYEQVRPYFTEKELVDLTLLVATINAWNRLAISFRSVPGRYKPAKKRE